MPATSPHKHRTTVGFARLLPWSSLILILGYGLLLSLLISNMTKQTALQQQQDYALLLARNLNHQIYRRFILPTIVGYGHVELKDEVQYARLEQVIQITIHGLNIQQVRIYDLDRVVSYCTDRELVSKENLAGVAVLAALNDGKHTFDLTTAGYGTWDIFEAMPGSVILKTTYPLRAERDLSSEGLEGPIIGILEITQDITGTYQPIIRYQWIIIVVTLVSSMALFLLLFIIMRQVERMNAERAAEREQLERELHQSEKLASIGRMVAGIAHEIRNPLGIIRSSSELLLSKMSKEDKENRNNLNARILEAIHDESKRLSQTVHDFLDYARPKQPKQETVDLGKVLDQALLFLESEFAKRGVKVAKSYQHGLNILGDKDFLYRAVYNIFTNSLQAIDTGGFLSVASEVRDGRIRLTFEDSGTGFDPQVMEKLFDPFFTTKDNGTGLGLTILQNIVNSHQGEVELSNREEGGARVSLIFPKL